MNGNKCWLSKSPPNGGSWRNGMFNVHMKCDYNKIPLEYRWQFLSPRPSDNPFCVCVSAESIIMYDAARVPSPKDGANGVAQPVVPGAGAGAAAGSGVAALTAVSQASNEATQLGMEEEEEDESKAEPVLVKKPHREILDHERKRRVELKCMELQEMMEEQGWVNGMSNQ